MTYQQINFIVLEGLLSAGVLVFLSLILVRLLRIWPSMIWPMATAIVVRTLAALYHRFIGTLLGGGADAIRFEAVSWQWAQSGCGELGVHLNLSASYVHSWIVANLYACTDRSPLAFQMINVALGVITVYLIARIARLLWDEEAAVKAAWIGALFPIFIINSAVPLREVWFTAFFAFSLLLLVRWVQTWRLRYLAGAMVTLLPASVVHGSAILSASAILVVVSGWALVEIFKSARTKRLRFGLVGGAAALLLSAGLGLVLFDDIRFSSIGEVGNLLETADSLDERASEARGGSAYPSYLIPSTDIELLALTPIRMVYALIGPPPWEIRAPIHLLGMLDGFIYLYFLVLLYKYRKNWWARRDLRLLFFILVAASVILGWGVNNFGTVTRHRAKFVAILIVMAAGFIGRKSLKKGVQVPPDVNDRVRVSGARHSPRVRSSSP